MDGVTWAVTSTVAPGSMTSMVGVSKLTFQSVGAEEVKFTFSTATLLWLVTVRVTSDSSLAWVSKLSRPSGVLRLISYFSVTVTDRSIFKVSSPEMALQGMVYSPAATLSGGVTRTVSPWLAAGSN